MKFIQILEQAPIYIGRPMLVCVTVSFLSKEIFLFVSYGLKRTEWWLNVVKRTFISAGIHDSPNLDATSWHLIKLYGTTAGWEVVPGIIGTSISLLICFLT